MDNRINFTQEELQLLYAYAACMSYGNKLSEIIKSIPNEETDKLSDRAKDSYTGDMILIDRLSEFYPVNSWQWNEGEIVELDDIACAIHDGQAEESEPFGDTWKHLCIYNVIDYCS